MLREAGLRVTRPRVAVLSAVHTHAHVPTDAIIDAVRTDLGEVSHQAVYDVLRALTTAGLLRRIQPAGLGRPLRGAGRATTTTTSSAARAAPSPTSTAPSTSTPCLTASDDHGFVDRRGRGRRTGAPAPQCAAPRPPAPSPSTTSHRPTSQYRTPKEMDHVTDQQRRRDRAGQREREPGDRRPHPQGAAGRRTNQDWWPEQLDLSVLHQHSPAANPLDAELRLRRAGRDPRRRRAQARHRRGDDDLAGLVARRLRPLRRPLHPDELARRRHLPHRGRPRRRRQRPAALRAAQQLARQRQPRQGPPHPLAGQAEVRPAGLVGRPARPRRQRRARGHGLRDLRLRASAARTSGSRRRSSGVRRTPGSATSATAATASWPTRSAPCRWA